MHDLTSVFVDNVNVKVCSLFVRKLKPTHVKTMVAAVKVEVMEVTWTFGSLIPSNPVIKRLAFQDKGRDENDS